MTHSKGCGVWGVVTKESHPTGPVGQQKLASIYFFQNKEIFIQLDELDKLDRITHAWIGFNCSTRKKTSTENILM